MIVFNRAAWRVIPPIRLDDSEDLFEVTSSDAAHTQGLNFSGGMLSHPPLSQTTVGAPCGKILSSEGNGLSGLAQRIETNDFQFCHPYKDRWSAAQAIAALMNEILTTAPSGICYCPFSNVLATERIASGR